MVLGVHGSVGKLLMNRDRHIGNERTEVGNVGSELLAIAPLAVRSLAVILSEMLVDCLLYWEITTNQEILQGRFHTCVSHRMIFPLNPWELRAPSRQCPITPKLYNASDLSRNAGWRSPAKPSPTACLSRVGRPDSCLASEPWLSWAVMHHSSGFNFECPRPKPTFPPTTGR